MSGHGAEHRHDRMVLVGRHAALFDRASALTLRWLYRSVAQQVSEEVPAAGTVLDVGTGPGHLMLELVRRRGDVRVAGIDPSADMVGHAARRAAAAGASNRVDVRIAAAESLPYDDGSFDAVVSTLSAHHWADRRAAVREQLRVLRPGGLLWAFDLRKATTGQVVEELARNHCVISPARIGRPASLVLVGYRAERDG